MSRSGECSEPATAVALPEPVRFRLVELAAEMLGRLPVAETPPALRRVARFAPAKRARLGAVQIGLALDRDQDFREQVAEALRTAVPGLSDALAEGFQLGALPAEEAAVAAYLFRPPGWERYLAAVPAAPPVPEPATDPSSVARLQEQLATVRAERREAEERWRAELSAARAELTELRRRLGAARDRSRLAEQSAAAAQDAVEQVMTDRAAVLAATEAESRRLRGRLAEAEAAAETARRAARERRGEADLRLRLLVDTLVEAAQGLRRELGLPPTDVRPADGVAAAAGQAAIGGPGGSRGLAAEDPLVLAELLNLPRVHLVVDGYNVTKSGYGTLTLEAQRNRLVSGLAAVVAARTRAEVTVVFDGTDVPGVLSQFPRGVRVVFTPAGEIADDWIRRLVAAEPPGRPVVVVSSDREVADDVRRAGAHSVPSAALLRLLG